jgi:hypothetical protein
MRKCHLSVSVPWVSVQRTVLTKSDSRCATDIRQRHFDCLPSQLTVLCRYLMLPTSMVAHTGTPLMHMAIPKSLLRNGAFKVLLLTLHLCEYSRIRFGRTGNRKEIFLASKFGVTYNPETGRGVRGDKEYVKEAANRSLQRPGVDMIDLYYLHR